MSPSNEGNGEQYPIPVRANLTIVAVQLFAIAACILALRGAEELWQVALLALLFGVVMNSVYAMIHEAEHGILHPHPKVNAGLGVLLALFFPAPYHLIRQGHIGHHLRNRSDDEAFDLYFDGEYFFTKCIQWYGILSGLFWVTIAIGNVAILFLPILLHKRLYRFDRPTFALFDSLNPAYRRLIQAEALAVIGLHAAIIVGLEIPPLRYFAMYFGFGFSWSALQYLHHYGTERHVVRGARNVWIGRLLDAVLLNHNWHLTHHKHPTVPWRYLPEIGCQEDPERSFLLWHYLKMWKPPRYSRERVENRYAGNIIR